MNINTKTIQASALALAFVAAMGTTSALAKNEDHSPKGNNGTVKIDRMEFDNHPNNEPHVGCTFQVDFYNYDKGDLKAGYTFTAQAPTGKGEQLFAGVVNIGEDAAGGGTDLDASVTVNLAPMLAKFKAHDKQGYHVKLTVNADGSKGNDVKHKVFWVKGCAQPTVTPTPGISGAPTVTPTGVGAVLGSENPVAATELPSTGPGAMLLTALATTALALVGKKFSA